MKRRRAIALLGAATLTSCRRTDPLRTFSDIAFGTEVGFKSHGISASAFEKIFTESAARLRELESLFSLHDRDSTISRLNREGFLESPPAEFLKVANTALGYGRMTGGIFDITVQPLWHWRETWKSANLAERRNMEGNPWNDALALVDYRMVSTTGQRIEFGKAGMAITLNGIIQGYATDQIVLLLKKHGATNALVNIGEYAAIGNAPDGNPWKLEISATGTSQVLLPGRALAVSSGSGYTFDPEGRFNHIFLPADGSNPASGKTLVVTASNATLADTLATTFTVASKDERLNILAKFPDADFLEIGL